jgi:hypothetical protein
MKCPKCQHENTLEAKFCEECAAPLARACVNCGSEVSSTAKFCSECGHRLPPVADVTRFASPKSYTPQHLADKILTSRAALEGERKQVTVLFADIKGSMELLVEAETFAPSRGRGLLSSIASRRRPRPRRRTRRGRHPAGACGGDPAALRRANPPGVGARADASVIAAVVIGVQVFLRSSRGSFGAANG